MRRSESPVMPEFDFFRKISTSLDFLHSADSARYLDEHASQMAKSPSCQRLMGEGWSRGGAALRACQQVLEAMQRSTSGHEGEKPPCLKCLMRDHYELRTFEGATIRESHARLAERYGAFQAGTHAFSEDFVYRRLEDRSFHWGMRLFYGLDTN